MNPDLQQFFESDSKWKAEYSLLRDIVRSHSSLTEEYKWMHPCYTYQGKNVVLIHGFKNYCALLFHKGVLLNDEAQILIQQTDQVQAARQLRFTSVDQIHSLKTVIAEYVREAVEIEKAGMKVELKTVVEYPVPEEFRHALDSDRDLHQAFGSLTPGRQKAYLFYFNQAKQARTREARIEKYYQQILDGKGLDDKQN
jgi:uncharacterized protein YdeI (YjbR/CyaY-like superfamily)